MTQSDYVKHSGLTKGRVSQLVKAGMPLTSPEDADQWRGMSAQKRAGNIPKSGSGSSPDPGPYRPPEAQAPTDPNVVSADTPQGAYERQRQIERAAYALTVRALKAAQPEAGRLVSIHAQAARNLTQARQEVIALLGPDHQGCPVLVLPEEAPPESAPVRRSITGRQFVAGAMDIGDYLARRYGTPVPHR